MGIQRGWYSPNDRPQCYVCRYALQGLAERRCPECGTPNDDRLICPRRLPPWPLWTLCLVQFIPAPFYLISLRPGSRLDAVLLVLFLSIAVAITAALLFHARRRVRVVLENDAVLIFGIIRTLRIPLGDVIAFRCAGRPDHYGESALIIKYHQGIVRQYAAIGRPFMCNDDDLDRLAARLADRYPDVPFDTKEW